MKKPDVEFSPAAKPPADNPPAQIIIYCQQVIVSSGGRVDNIYAPQPKPPEPPQNPQPPMVKK